MKVEQESRAFWILASRQRGRCRSGTRARTTLAKSPLIITASALKVSPSATRPQARLPSNSTRSTVLFSRRSTPMRPAKPAMASETAPQPPTGW